MKRFSSVVYTDK